MGLGISYPPLFKKELDVLANNGCQVNVHTSLGSDVGNERPTVGLGFRLGPFLDNGVGQSGGSESK
jgi:hypothetical protein